MVDLRSVVSNRGDNAIVGHDVRECLPSWTGSPMNLLTALSAPGSRWRPGTLLEIKPRPSDTRRTTSLRATSGAWEDALGEFNQGHPQQCRMYPFITCIGTTVEQPCIIPSAKIQTAVPEYGPSVYVRVGEGGLARLGVGRAWYIALEPADSRTPPNNILRPWYGKLPAIHGGGRDKMRVIQGPKSPRPSPVASGIAMPEASPGSMVPSRTE